MNIFCKLLITGILSACILVFLYLQETRFWTQIYETDTSMTTSFERSQISSYRVTLKRNTSSNRETPKSETPDVFDLIRSKNMTIKKLSNYLERATDSNAVRSIPVPNVVHYIWFGVNRTFTFLHYLSFRSVHIHLAPDYIFIHGDNNHSRRGYWWHKTLAQVRNMYFVETVQPPVSPSGLPWHFIEHCTDVVRIQLLIDYGGIYLDTDIIVLKSFDPLRKYPMVMGRERDDQINSGILLAKRNAPFLSMWLETYASYLGEEEPWAVKATVVPHQLAAIYPHLIHVEETSLNRPNWGEMNKLYVENDFYDWTNNYAVHVWQKDILPEVVIPQGSRDINEVDTTLGEISRYILYGSKEKRFNRSKLRKDGTKDRK